MPQCVYVSTFACWTWDSFEVQQQQAATHLSMGLTGMVCCAAPGTLLAAGVMPMLMDNTSYGTQFPPGSSTFRPCRRGVACTMHR